MEEVYLPLDLIKSQLNIDEWYDDEDAYLEHLCYVAQMQVELHLGYSLAEILNDNGLLPKPIEQAILLFIGHLYNNREATSEMTIKNVPLAFEYLLQFFKNYRYND